MLGATGRLEGEMVGSPQHPERVDIPQVQAALSSVDFPTDVAQLVERAAERGVDERIVTVLGRLPDGRYETPADVVAAVRELDEGDRSAGPRATAPGAPGGKASREGEPG